jgi:dTDP-glucose pyrophosphorylase
MIVNKSLSADINSTGFSYSLSESWKNTLIPVDSTLADVIRNLNTSGLQISLAVSSDLKLIGTLTDGDIRRALLRGLSMSSSVESIVYRAPLIVPTDLPRETVLHLMRMNKLHQLPVVDASHRVVGLHLLDELMTPVSLSNTMLIMAGGKGSRLRPYTEHCPKPLLPVGGKPILEHIIERAKADGFTHFTLAVHYLGDMIEEYFGDGERLDVRIDYLREEFPLGTAGALGLLSMPPNEAFVVSNGDVLTDIHYDELLEFHRRHSAIATMAVRSHEWQHPFGVVKTEGVDIVGFEEKPVSRSYINAGVYVLDPAALNVLSANEHCDMPTLFNRLQERSDRTIAYPMHEPWLDVGRVSDLERARAEHSSPSKF